MLKNHSLHFAVEQTFGEDARFMLEALCVAESVVETDVHFYKYYADESIVSRKYADKYAQSTVEWLRYGKKVIETQHLEKNCINGLIGSAYVGINSFVLIGINREFGWSKIYDFLYKKEIIYALIKVVLMNKKQLSQAQLSRKDQLAALLYLIGFYKKAYRVTNEQEPKEA